MIAPDLEKVLHDCFVSARSAGHHVITLDHLLLQMLEQTSVVDYFAVRSLSVDALRSELQASVSLIETGNPDDFDTQPSAEFMQLIQHAILRTQATPGRELSTLDILELALDKRNSTKRSP